MSKLLVIALLVVPFSGCVNCRFEPALGISLSLYNRGGTVSTPAAANTERQGTDSGVNTEGGGKVSVDPAAVGDAITDVATGGLLPQ